jgi:VWFA-related protein
VTDLTAADFEIVEDKTPQTIDAFQHIVVRANVPQEARREPNTVRESRTMLEDPDARAFVLFLDFNHVEVEGSHNIRKPLVDALDRAIGENDLVAVMTPEMSAGDLTFARKTTTIDGLLTRHWTWGEREQINSRDPMEDHYRACYPGRGPTGDCPDDDRGVFAAMIARRREKQTLDALEDLVRFLRGVREERKAVIAITDGWLLYRPDPSLARRLYCQVPGIAPIGADPRSGRVTLKGPPDASGASGPDCERDRLALAAIDDNQQFRRILDEANRSNTSFYPVDPRGLAVFDTAILPANGDSLYRPAAIVPPAVDQAMLGTRLASLRTLAESTDGLAIVNDNNLAGRLTRVVDDLSSYYLLGYYSTGKLDGKFHSITVRVKRPGVQVRARRGYLAATADAVKSIAAAAPPPDAATLAADAEKAAVSRAVAPLDNFSRALPLRIQAAAGYATSGKPTFWIVGEVPAATAGPGADVELTLSQPGGGPSEATGRAKIEAGAHAFRAQMTGDDLSPDDYVVRVRLRAEGASTSTDIVRIALPPAPRASGALFFRRGPTTGNREMPTADLRFHRTERIRVEVPAAGATAVAARLLDRGGTPLSIPIAASIVDDDQGDRWKTAQLALAPLAVGDYVIAFSSPSSTSASGADDASSVRTLVAFRIIQ